MAPSGNSNSPQGKKDRREAARETARREREAEKKRQRRNRIFLQGGIGIGIIAVIAVIALFFVNSSAPGGPGPNNMASGGIVLVGKSGAVAPVTTGPAPANGALTPTKTTAGDGVAHIVTYEDWSCPSCKSFEATYASKIAALVGNGTATLEVHPVAILDRNYPGSRYSSRAANVAACVANYAPSKFMDAQSSFYKNQPAEGSSGLSNSAMITLLKAAGVNDPAIDGCVTKESFKSWVSQVTQVTSSNKSLADPTSGGFGTPTVFVNNKRWDSKTDFLSFVSSATSGSVPAPTPSPSK